jgi:hypothetical protein
MIQGLTSLSSSLGRIKLVLTTFFAAKPYQSISHYKVSVATALEYDFKSYGAIVASLYLLGLIFNIHSELT